MVFSGEIDGDVGYLIVHHLLGHDLGVRGDLSAPTEPDARSVLECRLDGNLKPAGVCLCTFVGNRDSIRDYDKLPQ